VEKLLQPVIINVHEINYVRHAAGSLLLLFWFKLILNKITSELVQAGDEIMLHSKIHRLVHSILNKKELPQ
jgi:hypothetical protein